MKHIKAFHEILKDFSPEVKQDATNTCDKVKDDTI